MEEKEEYRLKREGKMEENGGENVGKKEWKR